MCLRLQFDGLRSRVRRQGQRSLASPRSRVCDDIVTASCAKALRRGSNSGERDCSSPFASAFTLRAVSPCLHDRNSWFASWRLAWTDERQCDGRKARWGMKGSGGEVAVGRRMRWQSLDGRGVIVGRRDFQKSTSTTQSLDHSLVRAATRLYDAVRRCDAGSGRLLLGCGGTMREAGRQAHDSALSCLSGRQHVNNASRP